MRVRVPLFLLSVFICAWIPPNSLATFQLLFSLLGISTSLGHFSTQRESFSPSSRLALSPPGAHERLRPAITSIFNLSLSLYYNSPFSLQPPSAFPPATLPKSDNPLLPWNSRGFFLKSIISGLDILTTSPLKMSQSHPKTNTRSMSLPRLIFWHF